MEMFRVFVPGDNTPVRQNSPWRLTKSGQYWGAPHKWQRIEIIQFRYIKFG